ncbi:MAG: acetylxylan esterase [Abditibacteriota bacterium]|nr:acetylxylan esterase [Abditibacteriota bacterium]
MALEYFIKEEFEKVPQVYSCEILPSYNKSWGYSTILTEEEKEIDKNNDYVKSIMYKGPDYKSKETRVFAWIGVPPLKIGEKIPAMVLVHGGGGTAFEAWVRKWNARGYAAIAMDTCGSYPLGSYDKWEKHPWSCNSSWGDMDNVNLPMKDQWGYQAVMAVLLGTSLLASYPQVDETKIGITGISWGGYLTCIASSVDHRFVFANPIYGCGNLELGSAWTEEKCQGGFATVGPEKAKKWLSMWDPSHFLCKRTKPIHWIVGNKDHAYWPLCIEASRADCENVAHLHIKEDLPHDHGVFGESQEESRCLAEYYLKGGEKLVDIKSKIENNTVSFTTDKPIKSATLFWTKSEVPNYESQWFKEEIDISKMSVSVPSEAKVFFVNVFDERDLVTSSRVYKK